MDRDRVVVDGAVADILPMADEDRLEAGSLVAMLEAKRELWRSVEPARPFPGVCILQIDQDVSAAVVKSVVRAVTSAGYPQISFMVKKISAMQ